jgi:hypothetical protein
MPPSEPGWVRAGRLMRPGRLRAAGGKRLKGREYALPVGPPIAGRKRVKEHGLWTNLGGTARNDLVP